MYGSNIDENGKELRANGTMPLLTGERVVGHVIEKLARATDQNGVELPNRWEIHFRQSNGKLFVYTFFDSAEAWAIAKLNRTMLHICTKIVSEEEYYTVVSGSANFTEFMTRIATNIIPKATGKTFTLKIVYLLDKNSGKSYAKFPNFPNFIELDGTTPSTLKTDPKYDFYEPIVVGNETAATTTATAESGDAPF